MDDIILKVNSVKKRFISEKHIFTADKYMWAVDDVSFDVKQGETFGIIGSSGCGKSTLAKMIVNLLKPDSGDIFFKDQNISRLSGSRLRHLRPKLQLIQQNPFGCFNPKRKMLGSLLEGVLEHGIASNKKEGTEYVTEVIEKCGMKKEHLYRYPHEFSGGQLQRLAIARAILLKPELVIADEIVSALDVSVQNQILELLMDLKKARNMSVIFISHDLAVIRKVSNRIIVMNNGKVVDDGTPDYIFERSGCTFTKTLRDSVVKFNY